MRLLMTAWSVIAMVALHSPSWIPGALAQSNYAERGVDIEYQGNGIPLEATLDGVVTKLDDLTNIIRTNRSSASLSCASRAMEVDLEFPEPFYGIVYSNFDRRSACSFVGKGGTKYHYEFPLSGCGTIQDPTRVFTNNILVRFHPSLELEGDEVKTIVCRYPEPIVPPPLGPPLPISVANTPAGDPVPNRLAEPQILMIICALLFLAMMLFGVACSYFCLKQRNIRLIRRRRLIPSSGLGSEITGITDQTIFPPFAGLKIPRAHASSSGSDQQPIVESSDTLPSDYPSESRSGSEMEEGGGCYRRDSTVSSIQREEVPPHLRQSRDPDLSSVYSDAHNQLDVDTFNLSTTIPRVDPAFDIAFRVKERHRSPAPSSVTSDDSRAPSVANILTAQERALTTILEREEWRQSEIQTVSSATLMESPPLNAPADASEGPPPGYAHVQRKPRSVSPARSLESQPRSVGEMVLKSSRPYVRPQPDATFRVTTEIPEHHETERTLVINEDIQLHTNTFRHVKEDEETETMIVPTPERPVPPPKLSTQEVDDLYLQTITETRIIDEEERIRRQKTEYLHRKKPAPLPPNWDVAIRTHPPAQPPPRSPSDTTVSTMPDWDIKIRQYPPIYEPRTPSESTNWDGMSHVTEPQPPPEFDVTIRQYPPVYEPRTPSESTVWDVMSQVDPQPAPDFDVKIRQYPPVYEPRTPSESTNWDGMSHMTEPQPPPDFDVTIRQYPPVYQPRSPSVSTVWDGMSQADPQPPPDWDVSIRQYPPVYEPRSPSQSTNWDGMSQAEPNPPTEQPPDWDVKIRQYPPIHSPRVPSESTDWDPSEYARSISEPPPPNWDVLVRVLNPPLPEYITDDDDATSILTIEDRQKWQQIITTESTLRTMLTEAVVHEDFERIRRDTRFQRVFEPKKWDVIIRVLSAPPNPNRDDSSDTRSETTVNSEPIRPHRRDPRSSRSSSLAPVHEAEYHRMTASHTVTNHEFRYRPRGDPDVWSEASANTQRSSVYPRSTADRSMHSEMVDHLDRRPPHEWDGYSEDGTSRPSLARSTSEFTENWQQRLPYDRVSNASENFSTASSSRQNNRAGRRPMLERSSTEVMEDVPQREAGRDRSSTNSSDSSRDFARRVPYERISSSESESGARE
ncbi:hypothetical protein OUZ56_030123 [Daphnia magna]|uniref:Papillote protein n=1 Tax=Daphnia magna TaxID=35525 RepID=A0ABQ9ZQD6_9CRUS|nr:hypothetical protein OUZ56_030123 [Daphnia magna]